MFTLSIVHHDFFTAAENLALMMPASQSSTYDEQYAMHAVDGNTEGALSVRSCTHTEDRVTKSWWMVDLGAERLVTHVNIVNRGDCCRK